MKFVFFPVSKNGENGLGDEEADGAMPPPLQNFWARTASAVEYATDPVFALYFFFCLRR